MSDAMEKIPVAMAEMATKLSSKHVKQMVRWDDDNPLVWQFRPGDLVYHGGEACKYQSVVKIKVGRKWYIGYHLLRLRDEHLYLLGATGSNDLRPAGN